MLVVSQSPKTRLAARLCTISRLSMVFLAIGHQTDEAYSCVGLTFV